MRPSRGGGFPRYTPRFDAEAGSGLTNRIFEIAATWLDEAPEDLAPNAWLIQPGGTEP